ncbi:MAG: hypothetical protein Q8Q39_01360 [bacterium]|nr:hypothetical protein [bacterium]
MKTDMVNSPYYSPLLATIVYHDLFDIPLTAWEVFKYQIVDHKALNTEYAQTMEASHCEEERRSNPIHKVSPGRISFLENMDAAREMLSQSISPTPSQSTASARDDKRNIIAYPAIINALNVLADQGIIAEKNGYYFLKGRDAIYEIHIERLKIAEEKWHAVRNVVQWQAAVPFVRAIFVSGSVAMGNANASSDVDLFIITEHGRIWTARFLLIALTFSFGKLRSSRLGGSTASKCCLNHFITTKSLGLRAQSLYNAATYARLIPVAGGEWLTRFYEVNAWVGDHLPWYARGNDGREHAASSNRKLMQSAWRGRMQKALEILLAGLIGNMVEAALRSIQKALIARNALTPASVTAGRVVASDEELAFHPESPERTILDNYAKIMLESNFGKIPEIRSYTKK